MHRIERCCLLEFPHLLSKLNYISTRRRRRRGSSSHNFYRLTKKNKHMNRETKNKKKQNSIMIDGRSDHQ